MKKTLKLKKYILFLAAFIIFTGIGLNVINFLSPQKVEAAWFNENWGFRRKIIISKTVAAQTNVYISFDGADVLDTSNGKFQSDCGDIRFTKYDGTILPYYINSGCATASTDIDVYFENLELGSSVIYMYYSNTSASNGFSSSTFSTEATNYTIGAPASEEVGPGPLAYWSFDEGNGTTAYDASSNANNGTVTGATWKNESECISGKCLYFDGSGDYVESTSNSLTSIAASGSITYSAWIRTGDLNTATTYPNIMGIRDGIAPYSIFNLRIFSGNLQAEIYEQNFSGLTGAISYSTSIVDNKWHFVSLVKDGDNAYLYVDGKQVGSKTNTAWGQIYNTNFLIGSRATSTGFFNGYIDEVKVYPYARSAEQIKADYATRGSAKASTVSIGNTSQESALSNGLVGYWPMDDNVSGNGQTILDKSGNGHNGVTVYGANTTGMDCTVAGKFGNGCTLDGSDDYVNIGSTVTKLSITGDLTVSAWMKVNDLAGVAAVVRWSGLTNVSMVLNSSEALVYNPYSDQGAWQSYTDNSGRSASIGSWTHVTMVRSNNTMKYYYNGVLAETDTLTDNPTSSVTGVFTLGSTTSAQYFGGTLDEIRVYNRALSTEEVNELYNWAPGPVAYFPLDENKGTTTVYDKSGNGYNGSMNGTMTENNWVYGKFGSALEFDGNDDYINTNNSSLLDDLTSFTINSWVKIDTYTTQKAILSNYSGPGASDRGILLETSNGTNGILVGINDGTNAYGKIDNVLTPGKWHFVTTTFEGSASGNSNRLKIYIDGNLKTLTFSGTIPSTTGNSSKNITIGASLDSSATRYLAGTIDEVRIYNYARTPGQIIEDMNGGHPLGGSPIGSQIAYWGFDEGYGITAHDDIHGYNGTLYGATLPAWVPGKIGKALEFTATTGTDGSRITYDSPTNVALGTTTGDSLTLTAWLKPDATQTNSLSYIVRNGNSTDMNYGFGLHGKSGSNFRLLFGYHDGTNFRSIDSNYFLPENQWSHVALVITQGTDVKIYLNGIYKQTLTWVYSNSVAPTTSFNIGSHNNSILQSYDGLIDEVKIYSAALTPEQIAIDMNANAAADFASTSSEKSTLLGGAGADPVGYWDFNENTGTTTVYDKSGNGNNGTMNGSMTESDWVRGPKGKGSALDFDGSDDYLGITNPTIDDFGTGSFSTSAWIKTANSGSQMQIIDNKTAGTNNSGFNFQILNDNTLYLRIANGSAQVGTILSTKQVNDGNWHHIVGTVQRGVSSDVFNIYVDGILERTQTIATSVGWDITSNQNLNIGSYSTNAYFKGLIDDVKLWNYALTPAQVAYEFNRGAPIGWWQFDECQGTTAYDTSGKNNNGTLSIGGTGTNTSVGTCNSGVSTEAWNNGTTGKYNSSLSFDGSDDYVYISAANATNFDFANQFSLSAWIKLASSQVRPNSGIVGKMHNGTPLLGYMLWLDGSNNINLYINGSNTTQNTDPLNINEWYYVTGVWDGSTAYIYVDGLLKKQMSHSTAPSSAGYDFNIGRYADTRNFTGQIDDVRIYNYALSEDQIKNIMNNSAAYFGPSTGSP